MTANEKNLLDQMPLRRLIPCYSHETSRYLVIASLLLGLLSVAGLIVCATTRGVSVIVHNKGPEKISNATVHVTGNSYEIGTLIPGQSRTILVKPSGDSNVQIVFMDSRNIQNRVDADCYLESSGSRGSIAIDISGNKISRVEDTTYISFF